MSKLDSNIPSKIQAFVKTVLHVHKLKYSFFGYNKLSVNALSEKAVAELRRLTFPVSLTYHASINWYSILQCLLLPKNKLIINYTKFNFKTTVT